MRKNLLVLPIFFLLLLGCQASHLQTKPALEEEGEVFLYIEPFSQEAEKLRFSIEGISALRSDGSEFPLSVALYELKEPEVRWQRLLASGPLPSGQYTGLSFRIKEAMLSREDEESRLSIPEEPVRADHAFTVVRKRALLLSLNFKYRESFTGEGGFSPSFSVFIPPKPISSLAGFVTNFASNNLTVFDKRSGRAVAVVATGSGPAGMALDQRRQRGYVALSGEDAVALLDLLAVDITNWMRLNPGDRPRELVLTPDGRYLLSVNAGSNTVSFIDASSLFELKRTTVGDGPNSILIDPAGKRAYVFNTLSSSISVIDPANGTLLKTIAVESGPLRGQFNRRGDRLYVINKWSPYLFVLNPVSLFVAERFYVGIGVVSIQVDPRTDLVYLGRINAQGAEVYDPLSFTPIDSVQTSGRVVYMTIDAETNELYLLNSNRNSLTGVNLISKKPLSRIDVGEAPYWAILMGEL
jgi:YVTN family beta-propeller protein